MDSEKKIPAYLFLADEYGFLKGIIFNAGSSIKWFKDSFGLQEELKAKEKNKDYCQIITDLLGKRIYSYGDIDTSLIGQH